MPKGYTKDDIEFHRDGYGPMRPAVNVKVYHYPSVWDVMDDFDCSEETAEKALEYAFESAQYRFWEEAQEIADWHLSNHFGKVKVYSEGRSGGWLVVHGLAYRDEVEDYWDALDLTAWYAFEKAIRAEIKYLCSWEYIKEDIEANRWAEEGAELYNFFEFSDGHSECFVDMKTEKRACPNCAAVLI